MLKYVDTIIGFAEVPDEVTLCLNLSNCPCHCKGCHSVYLAEDIGEPLDEATLKKLIRQNTGITCVALLGGDADQIGVNELCKIIHDEGLKSCWYSGRSEVPLWVERANLDYLKLGPYIKKCGALDSKTTNQRFYKVENGKFIDMTWKFWKKL